ncbi:MAG: PQQ-dependent dehydrogenase, methanol/ethanol family, partial [Woeseiaceae bacterium]|nr:PQQ-dependent dehydrogenase, methanol/ethanol family [Woeseiaceae bacterium]
RTFSEQRFSPLDQVNTANVADLELAWYVDLDTNRGQQATPIVVDGVLYSTSAWSKVQAVDAKTGQLLWQYDPQVPGIWDVRACCGVQNRGTAVWQGRVISATLDGRLLALDAGTGELDWEVLTTDQAQSYTITGAPRIIGDKVIIGNGGAEYGVRGYVTAYDLATGEQAWRFYTVPGNPADGFEDDTQAMAAETWTGEWWAQGGGGTAWDSFAYDPDLGLVYVGTGNGSPWPRSIRSPGGGDNLFLSSIVALDADTGEYRWHYQTTPGDTWDFTATQHMILADLEIEGDTRKVLMQAPKNGFFFVLDRVSGELISAENFVPVNWATHVDMATGRPVEAIDARYDETLAAKKITPGPAGSHNWHPMSYSPETGLVYIPARQAPLIYNRDEAFEPRPIGANLGVNTWDPPGEIIDLPEEFMPEFQGMLLAWDPVEQKEVWRASQSLFENGGVLSTAGNLVFHGTADDQLIAFNAQTGEPLWSADTQTGVLAPPITYSIDGEQYIAVVAGWGGVYANLLGAVLNHDGQRRNISRILAFKLNGDAELPPRPAMPEAPEPPAIFGGEEQIAAGSSLYGKSCAICHGVAAISGGVLPDLRRSPMISSAEAFHSVVIDGAMVDRGMAGWSEVLSDDDAEAIRAFVVFMANQ